MESLSHLSAQECSGRRGAREAFPLEVRTTVPSHISARRRPMFHTLEGIIVVSQYSVSDRAYRRAQP
jgi:hypothetical protein